MEISGEPGKIRRLFEQALTNRDHRLSNQHGAVRAFTGNTIAIDRAKVLGIAEMRDPAMATVMLGASRR
jgi:hypothetical protein